MFKSAALAVALATALTTTLALPAVAQDHSRTERVQFARRLVNRPARQHSRL